MEHECEDDQPTFIGLQFAQGIVLVAVLWLLLVYFF